MILLYSCDLFCSLNKYVELLHVCKHINPDFVILNGNLLSSSETIEDDTVHCITKCLDKISQQSKILLQFGGCDKQLTSNNFSMSNQNKNIINITNSVYNDKYFNFIAFNFVPDSLYITEKIWTRNDGRLKNINKPRLSKSILDLVKDIDITKSIVISHYPPIGISLDRNHIGLSGSYDIRSLCEGDLIPNKQPPIFLCAGFPDNFDICGNWFTPITNCICYQPSQPKDSLNYAILEIDNLYKVINYYHPKQTIQYIETKMIEQEKL